MEPARKYEPGPSPVRPPANRAPKRDDNSNVVVGSLWMIGLSLALFFLPIVNGLIGGLVGGYKVGSPGKAVVAAILPAIVVSLGLAIMLGVFGFPVLGLLAGATLAFIILLADIGIFVGAVIGGAVGNRPR